MSYNYEMIPFESRILTALQQPPAGSGLHSANLRSANLRSAVYLAAVSGGADSTAMLAGLAALRKDAGFTLYCVHVEHGIRSADESRGDAAAVEALCAGLEVPCRVVAVPPGRIAALASNGGPGLEGAARVFRQKILKREAARVGAGLILTGHTRDDLLETLLMRILRGSGPAGLAPMPRHRGRFLRPLLVLTRQDVLEYLKEKGISYRTDSTNKDIRFLRNRVRHKLVPLLNEFFPSWQNSLLALAETQSLTADFLASETRSRLPWESLPGSGEGGREVSLRLREENFLSAPPILREEAVFAGADLLALLAAGTGGKLCKRFQNRIPRRSAVRRAAGEGTAEDLGPVRLARKNGYIEMAPAFQSRGEEGFSLLIKEEGSYTLKSKVLGTGKNSGLLIGVGSSGAGDVFPRGKQGFYAKIPLVFRNHRDGDLIYRGGHKRRFSAILYGNSRPGYAKIITAEDPLGVAAFIGICGKCPEPAAGAASIANDSSRGSPPGGGDKDLLVISRESFSCGALAAGGSGPFFFEVSWEKVPGK